MQISRTTRRNILGLVFVYAVMASVAITMSGRLFGHPYGTSSVKDGDAEVVSGSIVVNTSEMGKDIEGYGGAVPVEIYLTDQKIDSIVLLPNMETVSFVDRVKESGLLESWNGKSITEALEAPVDAVSGATYTSTAIINNVRLGLQSVKPIEVKEASVTADEETDHQQYLNDSLKYIIAIIVALCAAILPIWIHNKLYRIIQQVLNVAVIGFWSGSFINHTMLIGFMSNGLKFSYMGVMTLLLLIVGFIYPLFGRHRHYCAWVCPLGGLQDLAGMLNPHHKLHISPTAANVMNWIRRLIWAILIVFLWFGVATTWIDYELFSAFIVESASPWVLGGAAAVIILSIWMPRPYCRLLCPTGTLMHCAEGTSK
ncbi:MAG: FMN-binding protein [Lepagella sp.]